MIAASRMACAYVPTQNLLSTIYYKGMTTFEHVTCRVGIPTLVAPYSVLSLFGLIAGCRAAFGNGIRLFLGAHTHMLQKCNLSRPRFTFAPSNALNDLSDLQRVARTILGMQHGLHQRVMCAAGSRDEGAFLHRRREAIRMQKLSDELHDSITAAVPGSRPRPCER